MSQIFDRRVIAKLLAGLPGAAALAHAGDHDDDKRAKVSFVAEGTIPVAPWPYIAPPPNLPPEVLALIQSGQLEGRLRVTFPIRRKRILQAQVYLTHPASPIPAPEDPPFTTPPTTALLEMRVKEVMLSGWPHTLLLAGTVISDLVISPYGQLERRTAALTFEFAGEGQTELTMFGMTFAGSHIVYCPKAAASLRIHSRG